MLLSGDPTGVCVSLDQRGLLRIVHPGGDLVGLEGLAGVLDMHRRLACGRKLPVLVDARGVHGMSLAARRAAAGSDVTNLTSRLGLLVDGPVSRVIGNFFVQVTQPPYPTRLFTEIEPAERWLLSATPGAKP